MRPRWYASAQSCSTRWESLRAGLTAAWRTAAEAWTGAETVELSATSDGVGLYTSLGFRERAHPTMRLGLSAPAEAFL